MPYSISNFYKASTDAAAILWKALRTFPQSQCDSALVTGLRLLKATKDGETFSSLPIHNNY